MIPALDVMGITRATLPTEVLREIKQQKTWFRVYCHSNDAQFLCKSQSHSVIAFKVITAGNRSIRKAEQLLAVRKLLPAAQNDKSAAR